MPSATKKERKKERSETSQVLSNLVTSTGWRRRGTVVFVSTVGTLCDEVAADRGEQAETVATVEQIGTTQTTIAICS